MIVIIDCDFQECFPECCENIVIIHLLRYYYAIQPHFYIEK